MYETFAKTKTECWSYWIPRWKFAGATKFAGSSLDVAGRYRELLNCHRARWTLAGSSLERQSSLDARWFFAGATEFAERSLVSRWKIPRAPKLPQSSLDARWTLAGATVFAGLSLDPRWSEISLSAAAGSAFFRVFSHYKRITHFQTTLGEPPTSTYWRENLSLPSHELINKS